MQAMIGYPATKMGGSVKRRSAPTAPGPFDVMHWMQPQEIEKQPCLHAIGRLSAFYQSVW